MQIRFDLDCAHCGARALHIDISINEGKIGEVYCTHCSKQSRTIDVANGVRVREFFLSLLTMQLNIARA